MNILDQSKDLTTPCVIAGFCNDDDVKQYQNYCLEVFKAVSKYRISKSRVWIKGDYSNEYLELVYTHPPADGENLAAWARRLFGDLKFGIVLNNTEHYHDALNRKIQEIIHPIVTKMKIPSGGLEMVLFVGNYGYTPFGIHKDLPGGKVLHLHLGPAPKTIFLWRDEVLDRKYFNERNPEQIGSLLPIAAKYSFKTGDLFFMPEDVWHIGETNELSIGIALRFNHNSRGDNFKDLTKILETSLLSRKEFMPPVYYDSFERKEDTDSLNLFDFGIGDTYKALGLNKLLLELYEDRALSMLSNGGFFARPIIEADGKLASTDKIKGIPPFIIQCKKLDNTGLLVFVRGYCHKIAYKPAIVDLILRLNKGEEISLSKRIEGLNQDEWNSLIDKMYRSGGIERVPSDKNENASSVVFN